MSATTGIGTSKTLEFPNPIACRLAEVAIDRERERQETHRRVDELTVVRVPTEDGAPEIRTIRVRLEER